jgi:hypothetical protein
MWRPRFGFVGKAAVTLDVSLRRGAVGLVALLVAAALAVTVVVGTGPDSAVAARPGAAAIKALGLRPGTVIVAGTAAGARRLRLGATLSLPRLLGSLSVCS